MPRFKRLHYNFPCHGIHVPVDWRTGGVAAICTELGKFEAREREMHGLLGDWRTVGSAAVCTRFRGVSASEEASDALQSHGATGSSWLWGLGGNSRHTMRVPS